MLTGNDRIVFNLAQRDRFSYMPPVSTVAPLPVFNIISGKHNRPGRVAMAQKNHQGHAFSSFPPDENFGPVIVSPLSISAGLIAETSSHQVKIWNTSLKNEATISQIQQVNASGIQLTTPIPVPIQITRGNDQIHTLDVLKDGPSVQNSSLIYTINSSSETITVTGQRVIAFVFEPNWDDRIQISYRFQTVLLRTERYTEQRRPLYKSPLRKLKATFLFEKEALQKFLHLTRGHSNQIWGVPIYQEIVRPNHDLQGVTTINLIEDITCNYNINLLQLVLLIDRTNIFNNEVKTIVSRTANSLTVDVPVAGDFKTDTTAIYPLFSGILESKKFPVKSDKVVIGDLEFREIIPNG